MERILKLFFTLIAAAVLSSCATLQNTTTQQIEIKSEPQNANITIDGKKFGTTPQVVNIDRKMNHSVKIELGGYQPYEIQVTTKLSGLIWLNISNGLIPGLLVDYLTGSMYDLFPGKINAQLQQVIDTGKKKK